MIDCGFSIKFTLMALEKKGCSPKDLTAILVTHEHSDHISGVSAFAKRYSIPVYMTAGTARSPKIDHVKNTIHLIELDQEIDIHDVRIMPVSVPHDAMEPCQFIVTCGQKSLGVLTDLGSISKHVEAQFFNCDALLLEANHDAEMLWAGPYPQSLKRRVAGDWGHLSNDQAASFLQHLNSGLKTLVLGHISDKNNSLDKVMQAIEPFVNIKTKVIYASQETGFDWLDV